MNKRTNGRLRQPEGAMRPEWEMGDGVAARSFACCPPTAPVLKCLNIVCPTHTHTQTGRHTHRYTHLYSGKVNRKRSKTNSKNQSKTHGASHTALEQASHCIHCTTQHTVHSAPHPLPLPLPNAPAHCHTVCAFCLKFVFEWKTFVKINYEFVRSIVFR